MTSPRHGQKRTKVEKRVVSLIKTLTREMSPNGMIQETQKKKILRLFFKNIDRNAYELAPRYVRAVAAFGFQIHGFQKYFSSK